MMNKFVLTVLAGGVVCGIVSCTKEDMAIESKLPIVTIKTPNGKHIAKGKYTEGAYMTITSDGEETFSGAIKIKGRGNSTWKKNRGWEKILWFKSYKNPYTIKLETKSSLLSLPKARSWVLLANSYDSTWIRNDIAFYMGEKMTNLEFTPKFSFVNLVLDGECQGVYQLGEKVNEGKHRVNVGKDGFLLEIDAKHGAEEVVFGTSHLRNPITVKSPDTTPNDTNYTYIKNYVAKMEECLYSEDFCDEENGYRKYLDVESFVDWYLVNEISKNNDACFHSSCFMNLERGGKMKMGPVWDFDLAFGGHYVKGIESGKPEGLWVSKRAEWYVRLFQDSSFVNKVRERFDYIYSNRQLIFDKIEEDRMLLIDEAYEDNRKWGNVGAKSMAKDDFVVLYNKQIDLLKDWLDKRLLWLYKNL